MKLEFLKTLWALRFDKIRKLEEESAWAYQEVLDDCLLLFKNDKELHELLRSLVREERMHEKIAQELIKIVHQNHPEVSVSFE